MTAVICFFLVGFIGYRTVSLILLLSVSFNAILFDLLPVMLSALLSALILNFFFFPPILTFYIGTPEDGLTFLLYFVIALINGAFTYKIKEFERKTRDEEEKANAIRLYTTLLNSLSHELRTPIATIIGAIDTIKDHNSRLTESNKIELYSEIEVASLRLNRQVENLLNMSRLEAGFIQPQKDWCDINELISSVISTENIAANPHPIEFTPDESLPYFKLDGGLLEQILSNLIHNALQHTPEKTKIIIEATSSNTHCIIGISDNGNGFPPDEIGLVFNKFYRLKNTSGGGTGLGLSLVRGFAEVMGGEVNLNNQQGGGAKFTLKIPCEQSHNESHNMDEV